MKNYKSLTIKYILIALVAHLIVMLILQEALLKCIPDVDTVTWARRSAIFTNIFSAILMFLIWLIIMYVPYYGVRCFKKMSYSRYFPVFKNTIFIYLLYELLRLLIIILYILPEASTHFGNIEYFGTFYGNTFAGKLLLWCDMGYIAMASIFAAIFYCTEVRKVFKEAAIVGFTFLFIFLVINIKNLKLLFNA